MFQLLILIISQIPLFCIAANNNSSEFSHLECRNDQRIYLPFDVFRLDACARCYKFIKTFSLTYKLQYDDGHRGVLFDLRTNVTHVADPSNSSSIEETLGEDLASKWKACCQAAVDCCVQMARDPLPTADNGLYCPRTWDGWKCWPDTPAGTTATQPCPKHIYFSSIPPSCPRLATKRCMSNGTWFFNKHRTEFTNYTGCSRSDEFLQFHRFHVAAYVTSIVSIVPALIIFMSYKQLHVQRIAMHKNLFLSLLLNGVVLVCYKSFIIMGSFINSASQGQSIVDANGSGCKFFLVLSYYFRMSNYMWMFCEGYYLHKLIAAAFAEQRSLLMFYMIGWGFPILPVCLYAILRATLANEQCWIEPSEEIELVMNIPNLLSLLVNVFFLFNIIRILVTKLRATHANEPNQYRKAVRATLVLVPLFGLHFCFVIYRPHTGKCGLYEAYMYLNYAMDGLQGFMVAVIFCYLNGEVLYLLKRSYQRYKLHLQIRGSLNSSAVLRRMSATQDSTLNDSQNHHHHHNSHKTKYKEKKLREINGRTEDKNAINDHSKPIIQS